jgi:hypothetical protein
MRLGNRQHEVMEDKTLRARRLTSLSSPSQVPCQSSPSTQVTPVTKRLDSIVGRIAPESGST